MKTQNKILTQAKLYKAAEEVDVIPPEFDEENVRQQMAEEFDVDPELRDEVEVEDSHFSSFGVPCYEVTIDDNTYTVCENEDAAEKIAIEVVKQDLEDEPEIFNPEFIISHLGGTAQNFFEELWEENYTFYAEGIAGEDDGVFENRLVQEMVEQGIVSEEQALSEDFDYEDYVEDFVRKLVTIVMERDGVGYEEYAFQFGEDEARKLVMEKGLIDIDEAAEYAVNIDGWRYFISRYNGRSDETPAGFVFWREA